MSIRASLLDQALVVAGNFAFTVALVRVAGVDAYGTYTLLWGVVQLLVAAQGSLFIAPYQSLGHQLESRYGDSYLHAIFQQQQLYALIVSICFFGGLLSLESQHAQDPLPVAVAATAYLALTQEYFRRFQLTTGRIWVALVGDGFRYVAPVALLTSRASATTTEIFVLLALACGPSLALNLRSYVRVVRGKGVAAYPDVLKAHWPFVRWLTPSIALQWINANMVFYAVGSFVGETEVGLLRMAQTMSILYLVLLEVLENVVPRQAAIRQQTGGQSEMVRYVLRIGAWAAVALVVFLSVILPWADFWLQFLFGARARVVPVGFVWMFCMLPALTLPTYCLNVLLRSVGATSVIFGGDLVASVASLSGILGVAWYGGGAAVVTIVVAQGLRLLVLIAAYKRIGTRTIGS